MARGYSEAPSLGLPRPGRALRAVLLGLFAIWLAFAVGLNWGGASPAIFELLCGNTERILHGEIWRLFTAPLLHIPSGTISHILFTLLGLYFLSPSLEREWGPKRFLRFLGGSAVFAYAFQMAVELALPATVAEKVVPSMWFGAGAVVSAVSIAWALTFRGRTINLMFVIPVTTRGLLIFVVLMNVMYLIAQVAAPEGLIAPFGGMLAGWLFGSGSPSPLRRAWLKLKLAQLDAEARREADARKQRVAKSGLQVLEGGRGRDDDDDEPKKPPGGWLN
jgi:membrane associated rhomboid family serine protease